MKTKEFDIPEESLLHDYKLLLELFMKKKQTDGVVQS